jgi:hypothetical protein
VFKDLGILDASQGSARAQIDRLTPTPEIVEDLPAGSKVLEASKGARAEVDESTSARAERLKAQIDEIKAAAP